MIVFDKTAIGHTVYFHAKAIDEWREARIVARCPSAWGERPMCVIEVDGGSRRSVLCQHLYWPSEYYSVTKKNEPPQPETTGMNYSTAALLLNPKCRAIKVSYDIGGADGKTPLDIKLRKTFDETIAEGDLVIVPTDTRYKFTIVKVVETDVEWEPDTSENVTWIVGKVDTGGFEKMKEAENDMISLVKESEKTARRKKVQEQMFAHVDAASLNSLTLTKAAGNNTVIEHKPVADEPKTS